MCYLIRVTVTLGVHRFLRYASVGVGTFVLDLGMLYVSTSIFGVPYYISTPCAFLIALSINYMISRRVVFTKTERTWHRGYVYFTAVGAVGAFLTTSLVALLVVYGGLQYLIARGIVAVIVGMCNYFFNLFVNFKVVGKH